MKFLFAFLFVLSTAQAFDGCELCADNSVCCRAGCCDQRENGGRQQNCSRSSQVNCAYLPVGSYCQAVNNEPGICAMINSNAKCECIPESI